MDRPNRVSLGPPPDSLAFVTNQLTSMKQNGFLTDFTITAQAEEPKLHCHKVALAIFSPYFETLFTTKTDTVHFDEFSLETMRFIVDYCYCEEINFPEDQLIPIITASDFLQIDRLTKRCVKEVKQEFLNPENVIEYLTLAVGQNLPHIKSWCLEILSKNFPEIPEQDFTEDQLIPLITVCDYLEKPKLKKMCVQKVKSFLHPKNVLRYLTFAIEQKLQDVKSWCLDIIKKNFAEVSAQPAFIDLSYTDLHEYMIEVVQSNVKRDDVLNAIFKWIEHDTPQRTKYLEEFLHQAEPVKCSLQMILEAMTTYEKMITSNSKAYRLLLQSIKEKSSDPVESKHSEKRLLIVGGQVGERLSPTCWELKKKKFSKLCQIPFLGLAKMHSVCPTPGGFVLTGGEKSDLCMLFVVSTKEWREMEKMLKTRCMHASICINNKLYVLCGAVSDTESASVNCLSLTSKSKWEEQRHAPVTACWPKVAELDGKLYMVASESTSRLLEYDIENGQWRTLKPYPEDVNPTSSMIAFNDQQLCVAGGENMICAFYNPDTETWSTDQQKPSKSHKFGSLVQQNNTTLLIVGGYGTDRIEEFKEAEKCWSTWKVKMPAKLWHHTAMFFNIP